MRMTTRNETAADHDEAEGRSAEALRPGLRERFRPYLAGAAVLLVGCAVTLFVFLDVRRQHLQQLDDEFQDEASEIYQLLQRTIDWHVDVLSGLSGLFNASVLVTEEEFETFVAPALERQPHIHMLGWAPRLPADELPSRVNLLRGRGIADVIDPATGAPYQTVPQRDLFPIVFGRPVPEQGLTRGFDLAGDVILRTAMAWARDSGLPTASRPLDLVGGDGAGRGIVIFCPLFARDSDPVDYVERREALTGFVVLALRIEDMVDWAVDHLPGFDLDIRLSDIGTAPAKSFVYHYDAERRETLVEPSPIRDSRFVFDRTPLQIATRAWRAEFAPTDRFVGRFASVQPAIVLIVGLVLTALVAFYAQREARNTERIKALVRIRTTALEEEVEKRRAAQGALRHRVEELEEIRDRLERQGEQLAEFARDLGRARDKADAANAAKSAFLATMSHELRTPLNAIIGFSELIRDELAGDIGDRKYCDYARDIHASGQHLLALINDILDVSKAEAGKLEINDEVVDVAESVRSCIRLCQARADSAGAELVEDLPADLPQLRADRRRFKQILINLITNALKFTSGSGTVTIGGYLDQDGCMAVEVRDSGIGMTEREIDKALEPFGQVDTAINRRHPGTGLGLPLTKSMVEVHGGQLVIESRVGQGTMVRALFPAQRVVRDPTPVENGRRAVGSPAE